MMRARLSQEGRFRAKAQGAQSTLRQKADEPSESLEDYISHLGELGVPCDYARNLPPRSPGLIDLQWFAAEDEGRTEEPSEYKLRKAREEGRVAKSQELIAAVGLLLPAAAIVILSPYLARTMREMVIYYLSLAGKADITTDGGPIAMAFFEYFAKLTLPIAAVAVIGAIVSNLLQVGFLFTAKPITPDFSKIVPHFGQYLKRTMFSVEGLFNLAKSIVKVIIIGFVSYLVIQGEFDKLRTLFEGPFWPSVTYIFSLAMRLVIIVAVAMLVLAIPDYMFQRRQYMEGLKMTKEEVKEERKMQEGDPMVKGRLRERMRELLSRNMAANVPKADVVITNPTHFAIALEWDRERMVAPTVTAKGMDEVAQRIKRIAIDNGVPLVENRPLARALYADVEIGDAIPDKYYQAIAAVLAHVYGGQAELSDEESRSSLAGATAGRAAGRAETAGAAL
jgi:flagellar biosynthesis protein FlhB